MYTIISGTNRPDSKSYKLALIYQKKLNEIGVDSLILSLKDLPVTFAFSEQFGNRTPAFDEILKKHIEPVNKFIFMVPEYNGGFPGVLKTLIDCVPPSFFHGKKAALVGLSSGHLGNTRGLDALTNVLHYLQVEVLSIKPKLSGIEKIINDKGEIINTSTLDRIDKQIEKFVSF